jgi:dipeptidyl aminopeptidase/acylaminoacyl peptidase
MLIVHGTADQGVSITQSQNMARRLAELNVLVETYYIPDVDHGFAGKTPERTHDANDKALQHTFDDIDKLFSRDRRQ